MGTGLEMGGVRIPRLTTDPLLTHGLENHLIEELLVDVAIVQTATAVLTSGRGVGDLIGEPQAEEPAIGDIDVHFTDQQAFTTNTKQIADQQPLEQ